MRVLVTLPVEPAWRDIIHETLSDDAEITFLEDLDASDRGRAIEAADGLLAWNPHDELSDEELRAAASAEFMQLMSAGADHLDFAAVPDSLTVASNAGAYAEPVAEHVLALALALARRLRAEHEKMRDGAFNQRSPNQSLRGSTIGIVGFGGIGRAVADLFEPLDVEVMALNSTGGVDRAVAWCGTLEAIDELLVRSDVVVLSIPLKPATEGLIGRSELETMQSDAILINVARGEIVDQEALYEHLTSHPEFKAGLEAWWTEPFRHGEFRTEYPFLELENVIGCPHNSAVVPNALEEGLRKAAHNLEQHFVWGESEGIVDPEAYT